MQISHTHIYSYAILIQGREIDGFSNATCQLWSRKEVMFFNIKTNGFVIVVTLW